SDGWVMGPDRRLLFWVPPASRNPFHNPLTAFVLPRGGPELDLSRMARGTLAAVLQGLGLQPFPFFAVNECDLRSS
ncbi:hypothetical protein CY34DRAFT_87666, partial [Suillus luteus UH-Slu-Lm8-n1]